MQILNWFRTKELVTFRLLYILLRYGKRREIRKLNSKKRQKFEIS